MRKTMSLKQVEANRRNARKSTGPRTANGKAVSKMNALKHGLLSQSVVVDGVQIKESPDEFKKLCQEFYADLAPVGPLEEMLVNQIVQATWRLRRARTAESGEITLSVDGGWWERENHNPLPLLLALPPNPYSEGLFFKLRQSVWGCRFLLRCLEGLRQAVERDGELTEAALQNFKGELRDQADHLGDKLEEFRAWLAANPEKLEPETLRARHQRDVMQFLDNHTRGVLRYMEMCEEREESEEEARQSAAVLPSEAVLNRILRYETALERQWYRAMHQLERLQRRRQGENIPAPVAMEITTRV